MTSPSPAPTIRAVCFDLDGLMFNTEHVFYESADVLLQRRGLGMSRGAMDAMLGRRPLESFQALIDFLGLKEGPAELLTESRVVFHELLLTKLQPMPGLFELLDLIEAVGLPKGVATSSPRDYLEDVFGRFNLLSRFPIALTAESVTHGKPNPEIYLKAAEQLGVHPSEMLVLEDTQTGTRAGAAAGAYVVSVPHEHTATHDFSQAKYIATGLNDPFVIGLVQGAK
ncbi:MAG: HAD-superfamily hydrolase, subfamily variant 3 [Schlesneria sp.]|nr:HAD-superfamily hydrolase, subfamily variant 3 [Schlesneria sp.]